jgi:hypothetical protein
MKSYIRIVFTVAASLLFFLSASAPAGDRLGASEEEMARLKELNKSDTVASQSDAELTKLMVGKWTTGRHEYLYRANGTWQMLPADISSSHGTWRIVHHQLIEGGWQRAHFPRGQPATARSQK